MGSIAFTKTFSDGSALPGSELNTLQSDVSTYINARNSGSATWDTVQATHATNVTAIFNNSTGTQDILRCQDNGTNVLVVADGGIVTMGSQSGVKAYRSTSAQAIPMGAYTQVIFNSESYDVKSEYNAATGLFTATAAGKYLITSSVRGSLAQSGDYQGMLISKNSAASYSIFEIAANVTGGGTGGCISISDIFSLSASDTIAILYTNSTRADTIENAAGYSWIAIQKLA